MGLILANSSLIFKLQAFDVAGSQIMKGMGLGLAVVKRLSEAQGGDISVESEMGIGTTVVIRMSGK